MAEDSLIPNRGRDFFLASTSINAKAHPACHPIGTIHNALAPWVKLSEHSADHSPPPSTEVKADQVDMT